MKGQYASQRKAWLAATLVTLSIANLPTASAAQPPMSEAEIDRQSDAAVVADVLGVACEATSESVNYYGVWVQIEKVLKGDLKANETLLLRCATIGPRAGGIHVVMYPGQRVKLYLNNDSNGSYNVWHQDGKITLRDVRPGRKHLPKRPGEFALAGGPQAALSASAEAAIVHTVSHSLAAEPTMIIRFEQSGGFAPVVRGCELDTASLSADDAAELVRLVKASGVLAMTSPKQSMGRDIYSYHLTLKTDQGTHVIVFDQLNLPTGAKPLVEFLKRRATNLLAS